MRNSVGTVSATGYIRRMGGGTQAHLLHCSDGKDYVVKFQNNPQGVRILANEYIFSNLARSLGFTVAAHKIVEVESSFIRGKPALNFWTTGNHYIPCEPGLQFGSEHVISPLAGRIAYTLSFPISRIRNLDEFTSMLVLDKWVCNRDLRQAVFWRRSRDKKFTATFIDHGWCFGAEDWRFGDSDGCFFRKIVYANVMDWNSFEPRLSQIEALEPDIVWSALENTPPEWYYRDWSALQRLAETLLARRRMIRELITKFRLSVQNPFPQWQNSQAA